MAWNTPPAPYITGHLVTASEWNTYVFDNPAYLKGQAGDVLFEDDIRPNAAATQSAGLSAYPWAQVHAVRMFAGPRYTVHKFCRHIIIPWEDDTFANYQVDSNTGGGGSIAMGGTGQIVLKVDDDIVGSAYVANLPEAGSSFNNALRVTKNPYARFEFAVNNSDAATEMWLGLRQTPGLARPSMFAENFAGFGWNGSIWAFENCDGSGAIAGSGAQTIAANTRYVIEIFIVSATKVEFYLNGTLAATTTTKLPTGDLEWTFLLKSVAGGGAGDDSFLTEGQIILQEDAG